MVDLTRTADFTNKIALVTGGARGIGRAIAWGFAQLGAKVTICYRNDHQAAQQLCDEAQSLPGQIQVVQADVGARVAVEALVEGVLDRDGKIDILVNNAGLFPHNAVTAISDDEWDDVIRTNLTGAFYCARAVLPGMIAARDGVIINMASLAGQRGSAYHAHYAAAKGGLLAFTRSLAREVAQHNVRVNAVAPGRIETEMLMAQAGDGEYERWLRDTPVQRLGAADEVAAAVLFLASPAAAYIIGETLAVNGGLLMT
ncbi:MAG: SDR family NAD(P)-dependent oxidoreductase [Caldilineaceae bacterium]